MAKNIAAVGLIYNQEKQPYWFTWTYRVLRHSANDGTTKFRNETSSLV